ncbi:MAG: DNA repair protein RecN [Treponemataceae bacterium]
MLEDISIKDFALIDSLSMEFTDGFTVFTGETGSGKSILIGAVSFLLGGKASVEQIRSGCNEAFVSGTLYINPKCEVAFLWLKDHGIETDNGRVLLRRNIKANGKSSCWIQDTPITKNELSEFTSFFVDIHGQHEHQSLMKVSEHIRYLDSYAEITDEVADFSKYYRALVEKRNLLEKMNNDDSSRNQKIDLLRFSIEEIENADLKLSEDDQLETEENRLSQYEKLYSNIEQLSEYLSGSAEAVIPGLKKINVISKHCASIDKNLEPLVARIENAFYEFSDIADEVKNYKNLLTFDPERLEEIQMRLALIFKLKQKYCSSTQSSLSDIFDYLKKAKEELNTLENFQQNQSELIDNIKKLEKTVYEKAKNLSIKRKECAEKMSCEIEQVLSKLGMQGSKFVVSMTQKDCTDLVQKCGCSGMDNVEFLICANKGGELKPFTKIASGGEISRVMLAIKTVLASSDQVDTLIFDEIDTGIGGEVAVSLGQHIKNLSKNRQIFCITHLATIAVFADTQARIEKKSDSVTTKTYVYQICGEQRVQEIARMLSGDAVDASSIEHAKSMLERYK